jgi:hypothetical protein
VWHGSDVHPHSELGQSRRFRDALKESDCPPPDNGYRMHTSLLQKSAETDSLVGIGLAEVMLCRWKLDWDDLAIVAWKKGGVIA